MENVSGLCLRSFPLPFPFFDIHFTSYYIQIFAIERTHHIAHIQRDGATTPSHSYEKGVKIFCVIKLIKKLKTFTRQNFCFPYCFGCHIPAIYAQEMFHFWLCETHNGPGSKYSNLPLNKFRFEIFSAFHGMELKASCRSGRVSMKRGKVANKQACMAAHSQ